MEELTEASDLVLVMGTSMGGLYADQVATECAGRALGIKDCHEQAAPCLGSVIINLQLSQNATQLHFCPARPVSPSSAPDVA